MFSPRDYLDLQQTEHLPLFEGVENVWEAIPQIANYLRFRLKPAIHGKPVGKPFISDQVFIGEGTVIDPGAYVMGPAWIGANCHIRQGAYIRENVIVGDNVVLGNSCEFKNCLIFNGAQIPHFSYVGDSILGHKAHLGAGVILSNLRLDKGQVNIRCNGKKIPTGLRKFGAIVGDGAEIGCHCVLNPGSMVGKNAMIFPSTVWSGVLKAGGMSNARAEQ